MRQLRECRHRDQTLPNRLYILQRVRDLLLEDAFGWQCTEQMYMGSTRHRMLTVPLGSLIAGQKSSRLQTILSVTESSGETLISLGSFLHSHWSMPDPSERVVQLLPISLALRTEVVTACNISRQCSAMTLEVVLRTWFRQIRPLTFMARSQGYVQDISEIGLIQWLAGGLPFLRNSEMEVYHALLQSDQ